MDDAAVRQLAYQYRPIVYLHSQEPYLPIDFQRYINEAQLKHVSTGTVVHPHVKCSAEVLGQWLTREPALNSPDYTLFLPQGQRTPLVSHYHPNERELTEVPLYVNYRWEEEEEKEKPSTPQRRYLYVSYSHMYAYNGPESICGYNVGEHYADLEHVTAELEVTGRGDVTFGRLYTSRHNGGVWVPGAELEWTDGHRPSVFSSRNGHASYTRPGHYRRYWGVAVDQCDRGLRWNTETLVFLPTSLEAAPTELKWTWFRGSLGDGSVACFGSKSYLTRTEVTQEYGSSRWPFSWRW